MDFIVNESSFEVGTGKTATARVLKQFIDMSGTLSDALAAQASLPEPPTEMLELPASKDEICAMNMFCEYYHARHFAMDPSGKRYSMSDKNFAFDETEQRIVANINADLYYRLIEQSNRFQIESMQRFLALALADVLEAETQVTLAEMRAAAAAQPSTTTSDASKEQRRIVTAKKIKK
jgi:hypothetical protein